MATSSFLRPDRSAIVETAYAKLNLTLEVVGDRGDGYHEIASLMQTVGIYDQVTVSESDDLVVTCSDDSLAGPGNIAYAAAQRLAAISGRSETARIDIQKGIPVASGLGGGSADAAAVLRGLNRLWDLGMTSRELMEVGAVVGSDVPFLIRGGTALVTGRGDEVEYVPDADLGRVVIVVAQNDMPVDEARNLSKTTSVYQALKPALYTNGSLTRRLAARIRQGGDCHPAFMFNVFQRVVRQMFPRWQEAYAAIAGLGARDIFLTGTGPAFFSLAPTKESATLWASMIKHRYRCETFATIAIAGAE